MGNIPNLSPLHNQLWAIFIGMRRAFLEGGRRVIVETDNLEALATLKFYKHGVPAEVVDTVQQIITRKQDKRWKCKTKYVFSKRNHLATYMASTGGHHLNGMVAIDEPIGRMGEIIDLDLGFGLHGHTFNEVVLAEDELYVLHQAVLAAERGLPGAGGNQAHIPEVNAGMAIQEDEMDDEVEIPEVIAEAMF